MSATSSIEKSGRKDSCATFVEQTKQLTTLASAFIVAPAAAKIIISLSINWLVLVAEVAFIVSVLAGYVALGAIAGSQRKEEYDVYRPAVMWAGRIQFFSYLVGLILFCFWLFSSLPTSDSDNEQEDGDQKKAVVLLAETSDVERFHRAPLIVESAKCRFDRWGLGKEREQSGKNSLNLRTLQGTKIARV